MRGILATIVMLFHFGLNPLLARVTGGIIDDANWSLCVDFFFLLSGFVLCRSYCDRRVQLDEYFIKRLFRLAPMYLVTLIIALVVTPSVVTTKTLAANLLMVQPFLVFASINVPSWSIPYELFLPVLIVVFGPMLAKQRVSAVAILLIAFACGAVADAVALEGTRFYDAIARPLLGLGGGMLLYLIYRRSPPMPSRAITGAAFLASVGSIALTAVTPAAYVVFFPAAAAAIYFGAPGRTLLSSAPAQALGRWSYSIYLIHFQVMDGWIFLFGSAKGSVAIKAAWIIVTIALAAGAYRWIERPMITAGARFWQDRLVRKSRAASAALS